jgi:hypothetical protein
MSVFTPREIAYLHSQVLGRLATTGRDGQPHVVPVAFRYNPDEDTIDIGGHGSRSARSSATCSRTRAPRSSWTIWRRSARGSRAGSLERQRRRASVSATACGKPTHEARLASVVCT